jgi:hypothetical protein
LIDKLQLTGIEGWRYNDYESRLIMSAKSDKLPIVPKKYAGQWIALNRDQTAIIASGRTFDEVRNAAKAAGESRPVLAKVPHARIRFLGGIR